MNTLNFPDAPGGICDFCSKADPEWVYPAYNFEMTDAAWGSVGAWAACDACSELIEKDDHEALLDRVPMLVALRLGTADTGIPPEMAGHVRDEAMKLHNRFRRLRKGPRRAFG